METFLFIFSDQIWLLLLEFCIAFIFLFTLFKQIYIKVRPRGIPSSVKRGEQSWKILLSFWALSIILIEIIISSELILNHKVIVGLLNLGVLIYLNLFSPYFRNKIIGWAAKLKNMEERL
jgi:hypothetical protein